MADTSSDDIPGDICTQVEICKPINSKVPYAWIEFPPKPGREQGHGTHPILDKAHVRGMIKKFLDWRELCEDDAERLFKRASLVQLPELLSADKVRKRIRKLIREYQPELYKDEVAFASVVDNMVEEHEGIPSLRLQ